MVMWLSIVALLVGAAAAAHGRREERAEAWRAAFSDARRHELYCWAAGWSL
jgi:hypothetical protein